MSVNVTTEAGDYLIAEANQIIAETKEVRGEL